MTDDVRTEQAGIQTPMRSKKERKMWMPILRRAVILCLGTQPALGNPAVKEPK